ncbi:MAG TPA: type II toxin-antitoxin system RelE/ParE family toxin [Caulobacteraceae bacterium]|nr:type II toxin-antitoxin system RelE/ParE family toxin [Caulobacteraceae bacterium]
MKFKVVVSDQAGADIDRLERWLLDRQASAAPRVGDAIRTKIADLQTLPNRGRLLTDGFREVLARFGRGAYVIRYRVVDRTVCITRIRHSRENR